MKKWVKRSIKTTIITLLSLIGIIIIVGSLAFYVILTPQRLTPIVKEIASEYIDANLNFSSVELTVFSTFPRVGVRLKDGLLQSNKADSMAKTDTIVSFSTVNVLFNPVKLVFENQISISRVILENPNIYGYIDTLGRPNWDVLRLDSSDSDTTKFNMTANLDQFALKNGRVVYDDRQSKIFGRIKHINMLLSGSIDKDSKINADIKLDSALLWQDGQLLARKINAIIVAKAKNDAKLKTVFVEDMNVRVNDLEMDVKGHINAHSLQGHAMIKTDSLARVYDMIPSAYLENKGKFTTTGQFKSEVDFGWTYAEKPIVKAALFINDIGLHYDGFKYGIDDFDSEIVANFDFNKGKQSDVEIKRLHIAGTSLNVELNGSLKNLFGNSKIEVQTDVDINFTDLSQTLPFGDSIEMAGFFCFNGKFMANLNDIKKLKWQNFTARGDIKLENMTLIDMRKNFSFINTLTEVSLTSSQNGETLLKGKLGDISLFKEGEYDVRLKNSDAELEIFKTKDSVAGIRGEVGYQGLALSLPKDSIILSSTASVVDVDLTDWLKVRFSTDTLGVDMMRSRALLDSAYVDARIYIKGKRRMGGTFKFRELTANSNYFPLPIRIGSASLTLKKDVIDLSKVDITVGKSNFQISGSADGLFKSMRSDYVMKIKGLLKSTNIDLNELMYASNNLPFMDEDSVELVEKNDTVLIENVSIGDGLPLFVIPKNVVANLTVSIDTLKFGDIELNNTRGGLQVSDQIFRLRRLVSHFQGSEFAIRALYNSAVTDSVDLTFAVDAQGIDVKKITTLFPYLDSLTPIIRSVDGLVDFDFVGKTDFYKHMNVDIAKFDASVMITAQKVEVPDNETLRSVAKLLMFKNKKVTKVDSVSMQMTVGKGEIDILPFILNVDRYRVAVGGNQNFSGVMDYHVSVLKSPVPIKFGVNITGNFEDFKVDIGKTKYKYLQGADYQGYINPEYTKKRDALFAPLVVNRKKE